MAAAAPSTDVAGIAAWTGVASALVSWLVANASVTPGLMVAAGAAVTGVGGISFADSSSLGPALATGAGTTDAAGIAKWTEVGDELCSHMTSFGLVLPVAFVAIPVTGGPVSGLGTMTFIDPTLGASLAEAAGSTDAPGIAGWTAIGAVICTHMALAQVLANIPGFVSPPGGGPLTGSGSLL